MVKLLIPFVVLLGVIGASVLSDPPSPRADFTFINRGDVKTLDLQRMSWMQDLRVARLLFEGLVKNDVFTWNYADSPGVAESWEISPDGRVYTFHLRADARWSNGSPVTAGDFVYSWRRGILPDTASDYSGMFQLIKGAGEFAAWRQQALSEFMTEGRSGGGGREKAEALFERTLARFDETVALKAVDDRTLRFELVRPTPYFLDLCAFAVFYPVYPPLVKEYESLDPVTGRLRSDPSWTKPGTIVCNGPFTLTEWKFKRNMRLERNPYYWNPSTTCIDSIDIPSINEGNAAVLAFQTGAVDWVSDVTPDYRADMLARKSDYYREHGKEYEDLMAAGYDQIEIDRRLPPDPRKNIHAIPAFGTYFYNFNCRPKLPDGRDNPFHDARVRRAFAMAVNKKSIVEQVRRTGEPIATTLIPPGSLGSYRSPKGVPYDPEGARKLLAEAGYPGGQGFIAVNILFNKDGAHDKIAQAIQKDWEQNLGVRVELSQKEIKVFADDLKNGNFIASRAGWYGDYGDATTFLDLSRSTDGNNDRKYNSPAYDALLDKAAAETDPEKRLRILEECERILMDEDLPMLPIFHYSQIYLFDANRLTGISSHPRQEQSLWLVDIFGDGKGSDAPKGMPLRKSTGERDLSGVSGPAPAGGAGSPP